MAEKGIGLSLDESLFDRTTALEEYSRLGLMHRIGLLPPGVLLKGVQRTNELNPSVRQGKIVSSTGEIILDPAPEFKVITPRSECISTNRTHSAADRLSFRNGNTFQTLSVHSLDDRPIGESSSLLLFHLTDVKNSSEKFSSPEMTHLLSYGKAPVLQRTGIADVTLRLPVGDWKLELLDTDGSVAGTRTGVYRNGAVHFRADTRKTLIYRLWRPGHPSDPAADEDGCVR